MKKPGITNPIEYFSEYILKSHKNFLVLKKKLGYPYNLIEYYDSKMFSLNNKSIFKLQETHFQTDEMYFSKTIGLLESFHIHYFSHYIISNEKFKKHIYEKFESIKRKNHLTGIISINSLNKNRKSRIACDRNFTDFLSTEFLKKELGAISLLNERTLNLKFYDKILEPNFRISYLTEKFSILKKYIESKSDSKYFKIEIIQNYEDIENFMNLFSELRNRILHRYHIYDSSSIASNKFLTFKRYEKEYLFGYMDEDDLTINEKLIEYLESKSIIKKPKNCWELCYWDDEYIIQNIVSIIHKIIFEIQILHWGIIELFIEEKLTTQNTV